MDKPAILTVPARARLRNLFQQAQASAALYETAVAAALEMLDIDPAVPGININFDTGVVTVPKPLQPEPAPGEVA